MNLKEKIFSQMPVGLSDLEKARYLYIELGKILSFSTKFNNTDDYSTRRMFMEEVSIDTFNKNQVNCIMWSALYSQLLTSTGIKNNIVNLGHQFVEFYIDNKRWCADATYDLYSDLARIHNNDSTSNFGPSLIEEKNIVYFDQDTYQLLDSIDKKLGYYNKKRQDLNNLKKLLEEIHDKKINLEQIISSPIDYSDEIIVKLEYLFEKIGILSHGFYESKDFVRELTETMLTSEELQKVKGVELKRTNKDKEVDIVQCIYAKGKDKIHYYLLYPNLPIRKSNEYEIIMLSILGYGIDEDKKIPGIDFPKQFQPGKISTNLKYKIQKKYVGELQMYDQPQNKTL